MLKKDEDQENASFSEVLLVLLGQLDPNRVDNYSITRIPPRAIRAADSRSLDSIKISHWHKYHKNEISKEINHYEE